MDGTVTDGWRVAVEGISIGGVVVAPTVEAGAVTFVSISKSVDQIPKIVIVRNEGFRRSETINGGRNQNR